MAQPVAAILSRQEALASRARHFTNDSNEAGLLVGRVISRAFDQFHGLEADDDVIGDLMQRDLDRMIDQLRRARVRA